MRAVRRSRDNVYEIHYHVVTPVKYRKAIFDKPDCEQALHEIVKGLEERCEIWFEQVGMDRNHVHWLISAAPIAKDYFNRSRIRAGWRRQSRTPYTRTVWSSTL
ncbi:MAG: transposase [Planctomycetes bacterium]|nr:transposase [Planctomycetota bacterium]